MADMMAMQEGTDEDEIMEAKLRMLHQMGYVNPEEGQVDESEQQATPKVVKRS